MIQTLSSTNVATEEADSILPMSLRETSNRKLTASDKHPTFEEHVPSRPLLRSNNTLIDGPRRTEGCHSRIAWFILFSRQTSHEHESRIEANKTCILIQVRPTTEGHNAVVLQHVLEAPTRICFGSLQNGDDMEEHPITHRGVFSGILHSLSGRDGTQERSTRHKRGKTDTPEKKTPLHLVSRGALASNWKRAHKWTLTCRLTSTHIS